MTSTAVMWSATGRPAGSRRSFTVTTSSAPAGSRGSRPSGFSGETSRGSTRPSIPSGPGYRKYHWNCLPTTSTWRASRGGALYRRNQSRSLRASTVVSATTRTRTAATAAMPGIRRREGGVNPPGVGAPRRSRGNARKNWATTKKRAPRTSRMWMTSSTMCPWAVTSGGIHQLRAATRKEATVAPSRARMSRPTQYRPSRMRFPRPIGPRAWGGPSIEGMLPRGAGGLHRANGGEISCTWRRPVQNPFSARYRQAGPHVELEGDERIGPCPPSSRRRARHGRGRPEVSREILELLGETTDGVLAIDARCRIISWNRSAERLLGYTAEDVRGRACYDIMKGRDVHGNIFCQAHCPVVLMARRRELPYPYDVVVQTKEGHERWVNVSTLVLPGRGGEPVVVHMFRDAVVLRRWPPGTWAASPGRPPGITRTTPRTPRPSSRGASATSSDSCFRGRGPGGSRGGSC